MKSTFQQFRDLPDYPRIVVRSAAVIFLIFGVMTLLFALALFTKDPFFISISSVAGTLQGLPIFNPLALQSQFRDGDVSAAQTWQFVGGLMTFWGILFAALGVRLFNQNGRLMTFGVTGLWIVYFIGIRLLDQSASDFFGMHFISDSFLSYLAIIAPVTLCLLFLWDNRVKAYFGNGPLAAAYANWDYNRMRGEPHALSPWEIGADTPSAE